MTDDQKSIDHASDHPSSDHLLSYFTIPLLTVLAFGFSSGLPLALTAGTLSYWMSESHVNKAAIGLFAVVGTPYTLKFLWSPLMDSLALPGLTKKLGRRRGWILATQLVLALALLLLGLARPDIDPFLTGLAALLVAFLSASQDIVIDAYRVEILDAEAQGRGAAMAQLGYQLGMIASGAGALYLATYVGWQSTYFVMACIAGACMLVTLKAREPEASARFAPHAQRSFSAWFRESVLQPFRDFMRHKSWVLILLFVVAFKLADAFIGRMTNPFLNELGFTKIQVANVVKVYGTGATLIGIFVGGTLTARFGAIRILLVAGLLHALTNLLYVWQAHAGVNMPLLAFCTAVENLSGGISSAAFVAYLSNLCNVHYTATQYALLSSLAAFGRTWLATPAGWVASQVGWTWFFILSALLALPGLLVLVILHKRLVPEAPSHYGEGS